MLIFLMSLFLYFLGRFLFEFEEKLKFLKIWKLISSFDSFCSDWKDFKQLIFTFQNFLIYWISIELKKLANVTSIEELDSIIGRNSKKKLYRKMATKIVAKLQQLKEKLSKLKFLQFPTAPTHSPILPSSKYLQKRTEKPQKCLK